jgi:hypothetical protein
VLKLSGGALSWGTDQQGGLTLPYSGSVDFLFNAFQVSNTGSGKGVYGESTNNDGVAGRSSASGRSGVTGYNSDSNGVGTSGVNGASGNYGWLGTGSYGVYGKHNSSGSYGSLGTSSHGVYGESPTGIGVYGKQTSSGNSGYLGGGNYGAYGAHASGNYGTLGSSSAGVYGHSSSGYGVYGSSTSAGYAGYFNGKVHVNGTLSKSSGSFKIDHPLDPEGKYLYHSFVESPDMMNIYNGNVVLDENGEAWVELPEWFEALNRDFRYQLTCIGGFAPVYIAEKIQHNRFKIAGGKPGMEVSWQVTGIRQDPWAEAHRIPVEEVKPQEEQGTYLHPEVYGQPEEKSVEWKRLQEKRPQEPVPASASPEKP